MELHVLAFPSCNLAEGCRRHALKTPDSHSGRRVEDDLPTPWKCRAELERQCGLDTWPDSYERYLQLLPEAETNWEHTEFLRLLLESRDKDAADRALRGLAFEHSDRPVVQEMLSWEWASYTLLHEATRERWWHGLVFVCDARVRAAFRHTPWRYAAACFGEAVATELRARVFGPLSMTPEFRNCRLSDREVGLVNAVLGSKATLGAMIGMLERASKLTSDLDRIVPSCAVGPCAWPTRCGAWRWCSRINRRTRSFEVRIPSTRSFAQTFRYPSP